MLVGTMTQDFVNKKLSSGVPHPGIRLRKECLEPTGLTVTDAAKELGISRQALNNILNAKTGIGPEMAIRLARFFGLRPETIQQWQKDYELVKARSSRTRVQRARGDSCFVSSRDLAAWADSVDARYTLPKLMRTLIRATAAPDSAVDFPAFEDAQLPGYDGIVDSSVANGFVPKGKSVWELSTDKNPSAKADSDYEKRLQDPLGLELKLTTLVMVSLRRWPKKREWAKHKNEAGYWSKVLVYDAIDLEQWLELVPGATMWLANRLNLSVPGTRSMEVFWSEYSLSSSPPISAALLLAGRDDDAEKASQWLQTGSGVLSVLADSSDEALAFIAAVGVDRRIENALMNVIVVSDPEQARQFLGSAHQVTFGWQLDDPSLLGTIIDKGHRAILPMSRNGTGGQHADLELNRRPNRSKFVAAIEQSLWNGEEPQQRDASFRNDSSFYKKAQVEEEAERRARACGRSITVYRRLFPAGGVGKKSVWASEGFAHDLVPILLAGSWTEGNEADHSALAELACSDYAAINRVLARWRNQSDSPLRHVGNAWELAAPLDAWSLLSRSITKDDLDRYRKVTLKVLGESDPALTLQPDERHLSSLYGKKFTHSSALRRALVESLIMLCVVADSALRGTDYAQDIVWQLLGRDAPSTAWPSLYELLRLLAEAEPDTFLSAVEHSLRSGQPSILALFENEERPLGGGGRYPHLLWALEVLAWFPDYLGRSARILAKLAALAPKKGSLANRPEKSLREIFCSWHPNTTAPLDQRLEVIDSLIKFEDSEIVWGLLLKLLPETYDVGANNPEPQWRALPEREPRTYGEIWRANEQIIARAMVQAGLRFDRLSQLIERTRTWSPEQRAAFLARLGEFAESCEDPKALIALWNRVRDFVADNRTYARMDEVDIEPWDDLLRRIEPGDSIERHIWLFDDEVAHLTNPKALFTEEHSGVEAVEAQMKESEEARIEAASLILKERGIEGIIALASRSRSPFLVGRAAAHKSREDEVDLEIIEQALKADDPKIQTAGMAFGFSKNESNGPAWTASLLESDRFKAWSPAMQAAFCRTLPENRETWHLVESLGEKVRGIFWKQAAIFLVRINGDEDAEYATAKLLDAGRALYALDQAGLYPNRLSSALLIRILDSAIESLAAGQNVHSGSLSHDVERILHRLRTTGEVPDGELGRLEWQYLPLLHFSHRPITLQKALKNDPAFFAEVVKYAFKADGQGSNQSDGEESEQIDEVSLNRARFAFELLSKWSDMPGRSEEGRLDEEELSKWFQEARRLNELNGRKRVGDIQIGRMLASSYNGKDGIWPEEAVRDLIDQTDSRDLESGLHMGKVNSRGVYTKSPADGGRAERERAKQLRSDARKMINRWQRTASVINSLADVYERFGRYDDATAEAMDLLP